jgi:hypothetical protein
MPSRRAGPGSWATRPSQKKSILFDGHVAGNTAKDNIASIRVLEKCGFEISGEDTAFSNARGQEVEEVILTLIGDEKNEAQ